MWLVPDAWPNGIAYVPSLTFTVVHIYIYKYIHIEYKLNWTHLSHTYVCTWVLDGGVPGSTLLRIVKSGILNDLARARPSCVRNKIPTKFVFRLFFFFFLSFLLHFFFRSHFPCHLRSSGVRRHHSFLSLRFNRLVLSPFISLWILNTGRNHQCITIYRYRCWWYSCMAHKKMTENRIENTKFSGCRYLLRIFNAANITWLRWW